LPNSGWYTKRWGVRDVLNSRKSGAYFTPYAGHEFKTRAVAALAYGGIEGLNDMQLKTISKQLKELENDDQK